MVTGIKIRESKAINISTIFITNLKNKLYILHNTSLKQTINKSEQQVPVAAICQGCAHDNINPHKSLPHGERRATIALMVMPSPLQSSFPHAALTIPCHVNITETYQDIYRNHEAAPL